MYFLPLLTVTGHEELEQVTGVVSSLDIPQLREDLKVKPISLTSDLWKQLTVDLARVNCALKTPSLCCWEASQKWPVLSTTY